MKCGIKRPKYCTIIKTLASPQLQLEGHDGGLFNSLVSYLPGLRQVKSKQLSATISLVETVAESFINTDM